MSAIPRPRSRLTICDRFIMGLPIAGMISMIIPDVVCLTDDGSNMAFVGIGYAIGCVSICAAAEYRCIRHSRGVHNGIRLAGRRVIRPRLDAALHTPQNALVTGAADRYMRLAARIMPRSPSARWYAEAAIGYRDPTLGIALAVADILIPLAIALILLAAILHGSRETCERAFRLLRWITNRPEPPARRRRAAT